MCASVRRVLTAVKGRKKLYMRATIWLRSYALARMSPPPRSFMWCATAVITKEMKVRKLMTGDPRRWPGQILAGRGAHSGPKV